MSRFAKLKTWFDQQAAETPWLRWAALAIGLLLALFALQLLEGVRVAAEAKATEAEVQLRKMRSLQGQDAWLERERKAAELHRTLLGGIPVAPSAGQAQAALQAWLGDIGAATGVPDLRISVDGSSALDAPAGVIRLQATIRGGLSGRNALNMVRRIESASNLMVIETIDIRDDTNRMASIGISAYYRLEPAEAAP